MIYSSSVRKLAAIAAAGVLALALGACGDGDSESGDGASAQSSASDAANASYPVGDDDQAVVRQLIEDVQTRMQKADPGVCALLSKEGQAEIGKLGQAVGFKSVACSKMVLALFEGTKSINAKTKPSKVLTVKVNGDTAVVQVARPRSGPLRQEATQVDGGWKVSSIGFAPPKQTPAPPPSGS